MNIRIISEEELNSIIPNNIQGFSQMDKPEKQQYLIYYSVYSYFLNKYMAKKINLKYYDNLINDSEYLLKKSNEYDMDLYQLKANKIFNYFYIRNNIYIERLTSEERSILNRIISGSLKNEEIDKFIESTYKKLIFEDSLKNGELCNVFFGPQNLSFAAKNNSLVIGFNYDEFNADNITDEEWDKLHNNQLQFLYQIFDKIENESKNILNIPVKIIKYNSFSSVKLNSKKEV